MRLLSPRAIGPLLMAVVAAVPGQSDEIFLVGGGRLSGRVVERTETRVAIETGPGRVTLPQSRVERIVEGRCALDAFGERAADLEPGDVNGWAELARWARERELLTQARFAWQRVLSVDPGHPQANSGLGRVAVDGIWMSPDDAYRARGYVSYEGRWLTPAEHAAAVREREADEAAAREAREADLRIREAEARVREAEARADEASAGQSPAGIPLGYGYGYGYGYGGVVPVFVRPGVPAHPIGPWRPGHRPVRAAGPPPPSSKPAQATPPQARPSQRPRPRTAAILPPQAAPTRKR